MRNKSQIESHSVERARVDSQRAMTMTTKNVECETIARCRDDSKYALVHKKTRTPPLSFSFLELIVQRRFLCEHLRSILSFGCLFVRVIYLPVFDQLVCMVADKNS